MPLQTLWAIFSHGPGTGCSRKARCLGTVCNSTRPAARTVNKSSLRLIYTLLIFDDVDWHKMDDHAICPWKNMKQIILITPVQLMATNWKVIWPPRHTYDTVCTSCLVKLHPHVNGTGEQHEHQAQDRIKMPSHWYQ